MSTLDLQQRLEIAKLLLRGIQGMLEVCELPSVGVTILVHDEQLTPGHVPMAVVTTLGSRLHQRVVLTEAMVQCAMADGVTLENAGSQCAEDLMEFHVGHKGKA